MLFGALNFIAQPVWFDWNNYNTTYGFYKEPENTIETVFLGASIVVNGIIPMELYQDYGICSYNLATEAQPMMASFYWLEETYRLHSKTLDTVVLDVSMIRRTPGRENYSKALDAMELSSVKLRALKASCDDFEDMLVNMFPVLKYHERWKSLVDSDFLKYDYVPEGYTRGYNLDTARYIDIANNYGLFTIPLYKADKTAKQRELDTESLYYLKQMINFCEGHDIRLVLIKTPIAWSSSEYNAVKMLAEEYHLDFLDFNLKELLNEIGFHFPTDTIDGGHPNYYAAQKLTAYLGNYLKEVCGNRDVREGDAYAFLNEQLEEYHQAILPIALELETNVCEYLSNVVEQGDYTVFISVRDEASRSLAVEQREYFSSIGLEQLSSISYLDSYLAVLDNGEVIVELSEADPGDGDITWQDTKEEKINDMETIEDVYHLQKQKANDMEKEPLTISYEGIMSNGIKYNVVSGGNRLGNTSSILIDGVEYSKKGRGINIVVYDKVSEKVISQASFDTHQSSERTVVDWDANAILFAENPVLYESLSGKDLLFYEYIRACQNRYFKVITKDTIAADDLHTYLSSFWGKAGYDIYMMVKDDGAEVLNEEMRGSLAALGLSKLSSLGADEAYIAFARDGAVLLEESGGAEPVVAAETDTYQIKSGNSNSGEFASVLFNGKEYTGAESGIHVVVYDRYLREVADTMVFQTDMETLSVLGEAE